MEQRQLYPIGRQYFPEIRKGNFLYIDKTEYVYKMTHSDSKYIFLSRPRRFGKTLLTYTLHSYFTGKRELFKGLAIENLEKEWTEYPVLHFDMSLGKHLEKDELECYLISQLIPYEKKFGLEADGAYANLRLAGLIKHVYERTGRQAVILIDEYDAPLLDVVHESKALNVLRNVMRNFYSPLKAYDGYLRFVFITGITKFSQLSIFSELNNIRNISMESEYAAVCGITENEIRTQMQEGIERFAERLDVTYDEALLKLKENYDGYHFAMPSPDIYNPYSLLNAIVDGRLKPYWFESGTPTYLIGMLNKYNYSPVALGGECMASSEDFDAPTNRLDSIIPLLYQSGYITIKAYDRTFEAYTLGIPNREVRIGLMKSLIPFYLTRETMFTSSAVVTMSRALYEDDIEATLVCLQKFLSTIPYTDNTDYEGHWQQVLYIIFSLIGEFVDVEIHIPRGRVDLVLRTRTSLYLIELKLNKDACTAISQINVKDYSKRFALCGLPVTKVGINFDSQKHTISDWKVEREA